MKEFETLLTIPYDIPKFSFEDLRLLIDIVLYCRPPLTPTSPATAVPTTPTTPTVLKKVEEELGLDIDAELVRTL